MIIESTTCAAITRLGREQMRAVEGLWPTSCWQICAAGYYNCLRASTGWFDDTRCDARYDACIAMCAV